MDESVSLKDFIELKFEDLEKLTDERARLLEKITNDKAMLMEKAVELLSEQNEIHFAQLNNEYKRIDEFARTQVSKTVYELKHQNICERVTNLENWKIEAEAKASQRSVDRLQVVVYVTLAISVIGLGLRFLGL